MKILKKAFLMLTAVSALTIFVSAQDSPAAPPQAGTTDPSAQQDQRPARSANVAGKVGQVTEATPDHFVIKTSANEVIRINYSADTRIAGPTGNDRGTKPPPPSAPAADGTIRVAPGTLIRTQIPASQIVVGDYISSVGEYSGQDNTTINATMIAKLDPQRVQNMRAREAQFGKTWLAGRITAITGTTITINGTVDNAPHNVLVDENTSLTQRHEAATLADLRVGEMIRIEGKGAPGSDFHATRVAGGGMRMNGQGGGMGRGNGSDGGQTPGGTPMNGPIDPPPPPSTQTPQ